MVLNILVNKKMIHNMETKTIIIITKKMTIVTIVIIVTIVDLDAEVEVEVKAEMKTEMKIWNVM
jgi:hypothetical protein